MSESTKLIRRITDAELNHDTSVVVVLRAGEHCIETLTQKNKDGEWGLCGGHPKDGESATDTAERVLREESGINTTVEYLATLESHDRRKGPVNVFYAVVDRLTEAQAGSDAKKVKWRPVDDLGKLGESDRKVIRMACQRVHDPEAIVREAIETHGDTFGFSNLVLPAIGERNDKGLLVFLDGNHTREHTKAVEAWLNENNVRYHSVGSDVSLIAESSLTKAYRLRKFTPMTEALILAADSLNTWETVIQPKLQEDMCVLCGSWVQLFRKRCLDRGGDLELIEAMFRWLPQPDVRISIDTESTQVIAERFATTYRMFRP